MSRYLLFLEACMWTELRNVVHIMSDACKCTAMPAFMHALLEAPFWPVLCRLWSSMRINTCWPAKRCCLTTMQPAPAL